MLSCKQMADWQSDTTNVVVVMVEVAGTKTLTISGEAV